MPTPEQLLEEYYVQLAVEDQGDRPLAKDRMQRASSLGKCLRNQGYQFLGAKGVPLTYRDLMPMRFGTWLHVGLQEDMRNAGIIRGEEMVLEKEYRVKIRGKTRSFSVRGHQDGERKVRIGTIAQEIKTLGDWRFRKRVDAFPGMLWNEVDGFHREMVQVGSYMDMGSHIGSEIWWWNRSNGRKLFHRLKYTPYVKQRLKRRLIEIARLSYDIKAYGEDALPDAAPGYKPSAGICKICEFRKLCWGRRAQSYE